MDSFIYNYTYAYSILTCPGSSETQLLGKSRSDYTREHTQQTTYYKLQTVLISKWYTQS